jgi:hypothetical protein
MATTICQCCGEARPVAGVLRRRPLRFGTSWQPNTKLPVRRHQLCHTCERWLWGVLDEVRNHGWKRPVPLLGAPSTGGRLLVFEDQCQLCLGVPQGHGTVIDCVSAGGAGESWPAFFACTSCDAWISSLAEDGRSARGDASRAIDGAYGDWPHPNLRDLRISLDVADKGAAATIRKACETMGVEVARGGDALGSVLFIEASPGASIGRVVRENAAIVRAAIVLAPLAAARELREALHAGASNWLTLPLTPQQVTAGLAATLRRGVRLSWDDASCLPIASLESNTRPGIAFMPAGDTDAYSLAWLLRRFARGYDEVVWAAGQIVLLPRVPPERLEAVRVRLELLLAGRCRTVMLAPGGVPRARIDLAG